MTAKRWPWLVSATLLLASGMVAGITTYLWWLPCRGAMLIGTIWESASSPEFSDECLVRMDSGTPYPLIVAVTDAPPGLYELSAATIMLAALAWLVLVVAVPMSLWARVFGTAFAMSLVVLAVAGLVPVGRDEDPALIGRLAYHLVDILGCFALYHALRGHWRRSPRTSLRLVLVLTAVTAFGLFRGMLDYLVMGAWSQANWDIPPGTGYLPALGLVLAAVGVVALTVWPAPGQPSASASQEVQQVDPIT